MRHVRSRHRASTLFRAAVGLTALIGALSLRSALAHGGDEADDEGDRATAARVVKWQQDEHADAHSWKHVKLLGFNDFHGQLTAKRVGARPAGGAAVLASYLEAAQAGLEDQTIIVHAGDAVGASPPESALLQDEPTISFLNLLANDRCTYADRLDPRCNMVGTVGNHEFDEGIGELKRLLDGGNYASGPFLEDPWKGTVVPYVSSNVVDATSGKTIFPAFVVKKIGGMEIGFVGAVLRATPTIVTPTGVAGLRFLDEADSINAAVAELHKKGVHAIVVTIHQGGFQTSYTGPTVATAGAVTGDILPIVNRLDDDVDVVVSGHTHAFTNALLANQNGHPILVTQAFSASTAYADIDLSIDPKTKDVVAKSASIVTTWGDEGPGLAPDPRVAAVVKAASDRVAPLVNRVIGTAATAMTRTENPAGESSLGNLIADAQRAAMGTDFGFMNPGGIRADLAAGTVTWGAVFAIQPFGNSLVRMTLTGQQVFDLLNQQFPGCLSQTTQRILKTSGIVYQWDPARPVCDRIVSASVKGGAAIDRTATYSVTVNNFMATGGDGFTVLVGGQGQVGGPIDLDALIDYVSGLPQPFSAQIEGRITRP